jgi:DNA-binding SARP family transcriptional activator
MPNALGIGLLGPLQVRDETGRPVHVGGRQLRVLLTLLALNAGRVVPAGSLAGELWPDDPPGNPGNALQTLVSRLRAELRQAGAGDVIESHPAGYRLAVPPGAVDVMAFEELAAQGRRALADGDAGQAARVLRNALLAWRGQPLADAAGSDLAEATAARLTELRSSVLADRIEADLALGEGASLVGELRVLLSADPLAERPRAQLMRALYTAGRQAEAIAAYHEGRELLADQLGVDPSAQLEQVYLGILRGGEQRTDTERAEVAAQARPSASRAQSPLTSFVGRDEDLPRVLKSDAATWLGLVRAELLYREGDTAAAGRICGGLLAQLEEKQSSWWLGMQAIIQARLALIALADGDEARCRTLLAAALETATSWVELPPVADVIDAISVLAQHSAECATTVASLLGAAHAVRGCFDEGSLDAPAVRETVLARLAADEFAAAYERGRSLPRDDALALAASVVANPVTAS